MYLRNTWYVAALSGEINRQLKPVRVLGENIVLYRTRDGNPVALEDACPHRKLPLSKGFLKGDFVECGYHGLTFDCSGQCVDAPTQDRIPPTAVVRSYPVADKWGLVWVWMGSPALADEAKILDIENFDNPEWKITTGDALTCECHYLYLTDNLLDPSHVAWVHRASFAAAGTDKAPLETKEIEDGLIVYRWIYNCEPPPFYAPLVKFKGNCDRLQHYEVRYPSIAINKSIFSPAGMGGPGKPLTDISYVMISYNFLTPVDENTTRYHWLQHRNTDPGNEEVTRNIADGSRLAFQEDREILEAVHKGIANETSRHINLGLDAGSLKFRRMLDKMIAGEQANIREAQERAL